MTNEEKQLLLKDLCARLPYGVNVRGIFFVYNEKLDKCRYEMCDRELDLKNFSRFQTLKPYLRSMESMTDDEENEFETKIRGSLVSYFDWLNTHHFDYRGLIEKDLAIEAPEGMYNLK